MANEPIVAYLDGRPPPTVDELHARLAVLCQFVGGILFEIDEDGRYLAVLGGDASLLAMSRESLRFGLTVGDVLGQDLSAEFLVMFRRVLESGHEESIDYALDVPRGRRNFRCEVRRAPPRADAGPRSVLLLVRDTTEETALRAKLLEAERLAAMGLVAASIGHEVRQPLAFATNSIEVLQRELEAAGNYRGTAREALGHVREAIRRIGGIASSVGVVAPDRARELTTDVRRPIEAAIDLCASELAGRARLTVSIPELPRVEANEGELCQVVANLLLNAAHAVEKDGGHIEVEASRASDDAVRISVKDDGCGIDPAHLGRVFDPFFTTKGGRGTGLGLFVSRRIVETAGGTLEIESLPRGTAVHVTLPINRPSPSPSLAAPVVPGRPTVLIIDDEPAFLRSLELVLRDTHTTVAVGRSADALALVRSDPQRFDAILCDLSMPEIDGVAFYGHMEALGIADRFVLMTAGAFTTRGEEFFRKARCRRVVKPFTVETLVAVLASTAPPAALR